MAARKIVHLSVEQRRARGREARDRTPPSSHAGWAPATDRPDPVGLLKDQDATREAWDLMNLDPAKPLQAKMYQERYFPGSTFKVVTGSIGVETGAVTPEEPVFPVEREYKPPDGNPMPSDADRRRLGEFIACEVAK